MDGAQQPQPDQGPVPTLIPVVVAATAALDPDQPPIPDPAAEGVVGERVLVNVNLHIPPPDPYDGK